MRQINEPLVSIIIPCYNAERWVGEAIKSALDQTYAKIEVVVVDDGSTDSSLNVIRKYDDRVRWTTGPNRGPCAARNLGFRLSQGDWIQYLDADDLLHPQKIDLSLKSFESYPCVDFIWAPHEAIRDTYSPTSSSCPELNLLDVGIAASENVLDAPYAPCIGMFQREFLAGVGPWNESLTRWVDLEYHARIAARARSYLRLGKPFYFYRQHDGARISNANRDHSYIEMALRSLSLARAALEASKISPQEWEPVVLPFYVHLSRSAGAAADKNMCLQLLREASVLKRTARFRLKYLAVALCARLFGIKLTSHFIEFGLRDSLRNRIGKWTRKNPA
jgi:glycosyltransferase involved in cell wall biosynthesis